MRQNGDFFHTTLCNSLITNFRTVPQCILWMSTFTYLVVSFYFYELLRVEFAINSSILITHRQSETVTLNNFKGKDKGNINLYSASSRMPLMRSDMDHTVLPANYTISAFTCKHSPGGATTYIRTANA